MWLTGHQQYQWLSIDQPDLEHVQFRCLITKLTPLAHSWLPVAFEANILCDCPYAYGCPFEESYTINGETNILFRNNGSVREYFKPYISFRPAFGTTELKIVNADDGGREFLLSDIPTGAAVVNIDNRNGIIQDQDNKFNLYDGFKDCMKFFRLVHGDNNLVVTGNGTLTIYGRFLYNVSA